MGSSSSLSSSFSNAAPLPSTASQSSTSNPAREFNSLTSPSIDTNNNKNLTGGQSARDISLTSIRRGHFSRSASGSRSLSRAHPNVCDCLSKDCLEKKHSNRRHFIEHYYNSRTQLPTSLKAASTSSFNVGTPLNKLSECDAITKRLLSSPMRVASVTNTTSALSRPSSLLGEPKNVTIMSNTTASGDYQSTTRVLDETQEASDKSRRASLGTNSMTDQVFLFASNPLKALEISFRRNKQESVVDNPQQRGCNPKVEPELDLKQKQQSRSLSVCDEDTLNPNYKSIASNHSSNLHRAISLACEGNSQRKAVANRMLAIIPLFGCDIESLEQLTRSGHVLPPVIDSAINHILTHGIDSIGIFRKSGVRSRILSLRQQIETNQEANFEEINMNNQFSIYDIADLVKMWFRELKPVPLLTKELIKLISSSLTATMSTASSMLPVVSSLSETTIDTTSSFSPSPMGLVSINSCSRDSLGGAPSNLSNPSHQQERPLISSSQQQQQSSALVKSTLDKAKGRRVIDSSLTNRIKSLTSPTHRAILRKAMRFLAQISSRCEFNQMTSQNLAICLTPSLCATDTDQNSIILAQKSLEFCIDNWDALIWN